MENRKASAWDKGPPASTPKPQARPKAPAESVPMPARKASSVVVTPPGPAPTSPRKSAVSALAAPVEHHAPAKKELALPLPSSPEKRAEAVKPPTAPAAVDSVGIWGKKPASIMERTVPPSAPVVPQARGVAKPRAPTEHEVLERGYPQGFESLKDFRDQTRPIAKLARDGVVFVSGSSVTGKKYVAEPDGTHLPFRASSDIDVGIASPGLRKDSARVQQSGPGRAFPVSDSDLDRTRGRTRSRHDMGVKVFNDVPYERSVVVRDHTPEGER